MEMDMDLDLLKTYMSQVFYSSANTTFLLVASFYQFHKFKTLCFLQKKSYE